MSALLHAHVALPTLGRTLSCLLAGASCLVAAPLDWQEMPGGRAAPLTVSPGASPGFTLIAPAHSGIRFTNQLIYARALTNQNTLNGAGVAAGDYDGDGWVDLYFCNLEGRNALYRNLGGWRFADVTAEAGVLCDHQISRGAVFADINGDGSLDLLVSSLLGPNACYLNDGHGHFRDVTQNAGLVSPALGGHSLTLADIDGDGDLDLYLANYGDNSLLRSGGNISVRYVNGRPVVRGKYARRVKIIGGDLIEYGEPDALYLNDGTGHFQAASWTDGRFLDESGQALREAPNDMGLSAMFRDINQDGFPDLYVCNDFQTPDRIWLNDGRGHFRALPDLAIRATPHFSMGVDFADIDRDGWDDFFVGDMLSRSQFLRLTQVGATNPPAAYVGAASDRQQFRRNGLFLNRGDGSYAEIANYAGVDASDWSWAVVFLDVDLDGFEDLLVANGHAFDTQDMDTNEAHPESPASGTGMRSGRELKEFPALRTPNFLFRNHGNLKFEEVGAAWGFNSTQISHGIALADLDNDGDLDAVVSCLWDSPLLYRNNSSAPRIAIRLQGRAPNVQAIGARLQLLGGPVAQSQEIIAGGRYLSGDDPQRVFAAAQASLLTAVVQWRNGTQTTLSNLQPNHAYLIQEPAEATRPAVTPPAAAPSWFADVSAQLHHLHTEIPYDDPRQPLLHKQLDSQGPAVAWMDLDDDGLPDLFIGAGRGQPLAAFHNEAGALIPWASPAWQRPCLADVTSLAAITLRAGERALLASLSNDETPDGAPQPLLCYTRQPDSKTLARSEMALDSAAPPASVPGPLAIADVDGDGDLDLFLGGQFLPGRYPMPATSTLFLNQEGRLTADPAQSFKQVGLVNGALFSDLTGDGLPELLLACEWGPVRVFTRRENNWRELTADLGLASSTGWWQGVTTGDFDGDGQLDIVAANWGLNSSYQYPPNQPLELFYADLDNNGSLDLLEALVDPATRHLVPRRGLRWLGAGWPLLRTRIPTHKAYAQADLQQILARPVAELAHLQATSLASTLFLNRGRSFEARPLPLPAQLAPAFGLSVADFNGDGSEDLFMAQNYFAMRGEEPRLDAGLGLLLQGQGDGTLKPLPAQVSGIRAYGSQRGCAVADFDGDGRPDLALGQNRGETKLYRNQQGTPGLRVQLTGPPGNPDAVGAQLRLIFPRGPGPVREIHAGSGHRSQDAAVQVLATPQPPTQLWVRWPGGKVTTSDLPANVRSVRVAMDGTPTPR